MEQIQISPQKAVTRPTDEIEMQLKIRAALKSMRNRRVPFIGPFRKANGQIVVATGKFVLTGNALIELMECGQLDAAGIEALVGTLNGHRSR
jgi:hypothetical protein